MSKKTAFVFPGQGSQKIGMLADLAEHFTTIQETFSEASDILHYDMWKLVSEGPTEKLNQTEFAQPALVTADTAVWRVWCKESSWRPQFLAGHSLGEYSALVAAEVFDFKDALRLVSMRAQLMQQAVPLGKGGMAAIIALSDEEIMAICNEAADGKVLAPANYNSIGQTVIAGDLDAVKRAVDLAKQRGAKVAKVLPVSIPSHCELMREASEQFALELQKVAMQKPQIPIIHNTSVESYTDSDQICKVLIEQFYSSVRWVETILYLQNQGVEKIFECGPGRVLVGLIKRIDASLQAISLSNLDDFLDNLC